MSGTWPSTLTVLLVTFLLTKYSPWTFSCVPPRESAPAAFGRGSDHQSTGGGSGLARRGESHEPERGRSESGGAYGTDCEREFQIGKKYGDGARADAVCAPEGYREPGCTRSRALRRNETCPTSSGPRRAVPSRGTAVCEAWASCPVECCVYLTCGCCSRRAFDGQAERRAPGHRGCTLLSVLRTRC